MTKERLDRYQHIVDEIKQLEGLIKKAEAEGPPVVGDSVQSAAEHPYDLHTVPIKGSDISGHQAQLETWRLRLNRNIAERDAIRSFIEGWPDEEIRTIMRWKYYQGWTWQRIAVKKGWIDRDTPANKIEKIFHNPHKPA